MKNYETVLILNPVLSADQAKNIVSKFTKILTDGKANVLNVEQWGLKKLAYPIQKKSTGFYNLIEFEADANLINELEIQLKRDESVMRFLTVSLDKHALEFNRRRRNGEFNRKKEKTAKEEQLAV